MKPPRLRLLGRVGALSVYLVSGEQVRDELDIDFTQGGNEAAYPAYVPKGEIWIDDAMHALDRTATTLHEIVERNLMLGRGWSYDRAHDAASARESVFRQDLVARPPSKIDLRRVANALRTQAQPRKNARALDREIEAARKRE